MSIHVPRVYVFSTPFSLCFNCSVALATSFQRARSVSFLFLFCTIHSSGETHEKMMCKKLQQASAVSKRMLMMMANAVLRRRLLPASSGKPSRSSKICSDCFSSKSPVVAQLELCVRVHMCVCVSACKDKKRMCNTDASAERCIDEHFSLSFFVTAREQSMLVRHGIVLHSTVSQEFSVYPPPPFLIFLPFSVF